MVDLTVLIVNYNTAHLFDEMFTSLYASLGSDIKASIVVIDNASSDDSVEVLKTKYPEVMLIENSVNVGFGRANNQGIPYLQGRYVLLLNTDAFVAPDTLTKTIAYMEAHPRCGVLGVSLTGGDGQSQPSCRYFPTPWNLFLQRTGLCKLFKTVRLVDDFTWDHATVRQCDWVPGCYYLIRREVIDQVGMFDPRYFLYYEEVDHCRMVKNAGWEVIYFPGTTVIHIGGESAKSVGRVTDGGRQISVLQVESEQLYMRKHHGFMMLLVHLLLSLFGDIIDSLKLVRHGQFRAARLRTKHIVMMWQFFFRTRFGSVPTHK